MRAGSAHSVIKSDAAFLSRQLILHMFFSNNVTWSLKSLMHLRWKASVHQHRVKCCINPQELAAPTPRYRIIRWHTHTHLSGNGFLRGLCTCCTLHIYRGAKWKWYAEILQIIAGRGACLLLCKSGYTETGGTPLCPGSYESVIKYNATICWSSEALQKTKQKQKKKMKK